jgi:hypothetical protein
MQAQTAQAVSEGTPLAKLKSLLFNFFSPPSQTILNDSIAQAQVVEEVPKIDYTIYDADIAAAKAVLLEAAQTKTTEPIKVIESLVNLEKLMRSKNRLDECATSRETLANLNGEWRLIFTTGTVNIRKNLGNVNYFPLKAVQTFNTTQMPFEISNGIFVGDFAVLKFFGEFIWLEKARRLEFDFDEMSVLGLRFKLPKGGAAKIGRSTGLGAEKQNAKKQTPFFNWISADGDIATARGGSGGLALWQRVVPPVAAEALST